MIRLLIDHRERHIAEKMAASCPAMISATTLTVGDFVFTTAGADAAVLLIIERKTLRDLADSIRDGRMENNEKLMTAQRVSGCRIAYLIEAADPYQSPGTKHGGITFGALTAKLDSLMLRFGVSVMWTRDTAHTIARISAMFLTFTAAIKKHGEPTLGGAAPERREGEPDLSPAAADEKIIPPAPADTYEPGAAPMDDQIDTVEGPRPTIADIVQYTPPMPDVSDMRVGILSCVDSVGEKSAIAILARYDLSAVLLGHVSAASIADIKIGHRRIGSFRAAEIVVDITRMMLGVGAISLTAIRGISERRCAIIRLSIPINRIVALNFAPGAIADIADGARRIGSAIETRIRAVFAPRIVNVGAHV